MELLKRQQNELLRQMSAFAQQIDGNEATLENVRRELQRIRSTHDSLESARRQLASQVSRFESRVTTAEPEQTPKAGEATGRTLHTPPPLPPIIPPIIPEPVPEPVRPFAAAPQPEIAKETLAYANAAEPAPAQPNAASEAFEPAAPRKGSFELRLGTYWLVRIGIVMLLTGVVFLATYAYKNFAVQFGPVGKVMLLYMLSGTLLGVGAWLYRKQEAMKNYAQVLFAGGLAAVYFTTYAAHHLPTLQVIRSAVLDGALLFCWAGIVVWLADRRKSETLALFAVGLAFYSSVMTRVGLFTLYSNLILTVAAVFFLVRNRWATLSLATLTASYGGYVFWRFYNGGEWHWAGPQDGLWKGVYFLMSYWGLFTAAVFTTNNPRFSGRNRASFLSLNNGAFFTLFILTMLQVRQGGFWKFALIYGSVLLALAAVARQRLRDDKLAANAYLTQGLLLVTVGFITYYSGLKLALVLAVESVLLTLANRYLRNRIIQLGAFASAGLSVAWAITTMAPHLRSDLIIGSFIGAAMIFNATVSRWKENEKLEVVSMIFFTVLGLLAWFITTWQQTNTQWRGLTLALESAAFVLASRPLANFALRHGALPYAAVAVAWGIYTMNRSDRTGLYMGLAIGAIVLLDDLLSPDEEDANQTSGSTRQAVFTVLSLIIWFVTTCVFTPAGHLAAVLAAEGLLFVFAFLLLKSPTLTLGGLAFIFIAQILCLMNLLPKDIILGLPQWATMKLPWWNPVVVGIISVGITHWISRQKRFSLGNGGARILELGFVLPVLGIIFFWLHPRFTNENWLAFTALLAVGVTVYAMLTRLWVLSIAAQLYLVYSVFEFIRLVLFGSSAFKPAWHLALVPAAALVVLSFIATRRLGKTLPESDQSLGQIGLLYRGIAVAISVAWVFRYIDDAHQIWFLALLGGACFIATSIIKNRELLIISGIYSLLATLVLWARVEDTALNYWPNLLVIVALLVQQAYAQRHMDRFQIPSALNATALLVGLASLWLWISKWVAHQAGGFYLTATWAALALVIFAAGFLLKDRIYRWSGLAILTCALGRVVFLDIWRLETIFRILSFMALGIVLLILGFIYTKYQEKIREWL